MSFAAATALGLLRTRLERTVDTHRSEFSNLGQQFISASAAKEGYLFFLNRMDVSWRRAAEVEVFSTCSYWLARVEKEFGEEGWSDAKAAAFLAEVKSRALDEVRRYARYTSQSTCALSNLSKRENAAAWEKILGYVEELAA